MDIKLNTPCVIYSRTSPKVWRNGRIIKETKKLIYWEEIYDSYSHAPSQSQTKTARLKKAEIDIFYQ